MKDKQKLKKTIKKVIIALVSVTLILCCVIVAIDFFTPKIGFSEKKEDIFYFPVDYEENIFDDKVYMHKQRDVWFNSYGTSVCVNEENYNSQSTEARFFYDYFKAVINGDYETHKTFFAKSFFKKHYIPEKFTMQKIYDIEISALTSDIIDGVATETFKLSYKIYENNGTFRADVSSGECKPVAVVIQKGVSPKIVSIIPIL